MEKWKEPKSLLLAAASIVVRDFVPYRDRFMGLMSSRLVINGMSGCRTTRSVRYFPESADYLTFVEEFLLQNEPCLFSEAATRDWRARQEWQKDGRPNIDYLASQFGTKTRWISAQPLHYADTVFSGDASVPVANCSKEHFNSHRKSEMRMADYLDYWRRHMAMGEAGRCEGEENGPAGGKEGEGLLYLKDWHFIK